VAFLSSALVRRKSDNRDKLVEHEKHLTTLHIIATNEDLVIARHTCALFFP